MSVYVVGDIQGCLKSLKCVLRKVGFNEDRDVLWSVGDVVNRGPKSLKTLRYLYERRDNLVMVLGNHDLHLMAISAGVKKPHHDDTLDKILLARDQKPMIEWLHQQPLIHHQFEHTMVHAGIPPQWSICEAKSYAREVESALKGPDSHIFLKSIYGNLPDHWSEDLRGKKRLRLITNYFTRMRYCTPDGRLDLINKGPIKKNHFTLKTKGFDAWFAHKNRKTKKDRILFGHWAAINGKTNSANAIGLDTGCVWGGHLSLYEIESREKISCKCRKT